MHAIFHNYLCRDEMREDVDAKLLFNKIRRPSRINLIIAHLNINSIRSKFDILKEVVSNNMDLLVILETKLDSSFTPCQLYIEGYMPPIRADRNRHRGGLMVYIKEGVPAREVSLETSRAIEIEANAIGINPHKVKWLLIGIYRPLSLSKTFFWKKCVKI